MKRRLRKKKCVGEFKELGFEVLADLRPGLGQEDFDGFLGRWLDAVESRHLAFGGGGRASEGALQGFVARMGHGSATEEVGRRSQLPLLVKRASCITRC